MSEFARKPSTPIVEDLSPEQLTSYRDQIQNERDYLSLTYCGHNLSVERMKEAQQALGDADKLLQAIDEEIVRKSIERLNALMQKIQAPEP